MQNRNSKNGPVEKRVRRIVYRSLRKLGVERERILTDADFYGDLGFDETDLICLVFLIENQIGCYLCDAKTQDIRTIRDLIEMIVIELTEQEPIKLKL